MKKNRKIVMYFDNALGYRREIARGVLRYMREHDYIHLHEISYMPFILWNQMSVKTLAALKPDGIIVPVYDEIIHTAIKKLSIPSVSISSAYADCSLPVIAPDIHKSVSIATQCFIDEGIKHLIFIGPPDKSSKNKIEIVQEMMRPHGISVDSILLDFKPYNENAHSDHIDRFYRSIRNDFYKHKKSYKSSIGIITHNDAYAFAVASSIKRMGMKIPEDVSIIGNDDNDLICEGCSPTISSIIPDGITQGYTAAKTLDHLMRGITPSDSKIYIPPLGIHHRESSPVLCTGDPNVDKAIRYIRLNACNGIGVTDVVEQVPLSRRALEMHFQTIRGHSPYREIIKVRIENACRLLEHSDLPNMHIALKTGFQSAERFHATFKQIMKMTPKEYRTVINPPPAFPVEDITK